MIDWVASITKLASNDGMWVIQPGAAKIGQEIRVDLDSRTEKTFVNQPTGKEFTCEVVTVLDALPGESDRVFPTELLDI